MREKKIIFIILISLLLFGGAFKINFFQDDYFFLLTSRVHYLTDFFRFFIPRGDVQFYRPVTAELYYYFSHLLFGDQSFGYHLIGFIFYTGTIFLVYNISRKLFKDQVVTSLFTFFWATSPIHQDSLYWIANFSYLAVNFLYLLTISIFLDTSSRNSKYIQTMILYFIGLLSSEFMISLPFVLFLYALFFKREEKSFFQRVFPSMILMTFLYLILRFIVFRPDTHLYQFRFDKTALSSLRWFILYFFGWPEMVKHYMVRFYLFSNQFITSFFKETAVMIGNLLMFNFLYLLIPVFYYLKNSSLSGNMKVRFQGIIFSFFWVLMNLLPIIFIPSQISPHRGSLAFFGFLLFFFYLSGDFLKLHQRRGIISLLIILSLSIWLVNSVFVVRLNERVHWVKNRADLAQKLLNKIKLQYPILPKNGKINIVTDDSEVKYALGEGRALQYLYNVDLLEVVFSTQKNVLAREADFLIINQIRGGEACCQPGSLDLIQQIRNRKEINNLPFGWALRYDALINDDYVRLLNNSGELGLLLEITPNLASKSGVLYRGKPDGSDWYFAKNAFLVGYSQEERKKIIDTLFTEFKSKFGDYPHFTVAWMIDAWSLNYINNVYGVKLHELTKEQYETDSYTLDGGIFNAPYYPSSNHPLIPGTSLDKLNMIIVRQTVSDILFNYGSPRAYYTSQPNDYLESKEGLDISYFQKLINETVSQPSEFQFGVLGFENSYSFQKYGNEYLKQLEYVVELQNQGKLKIRRPSEYAQDFTKKYQNNPPFYLEKDFDGDKKSGVLWYFGKTYRARILLKDKQVILDDFRIYSLIADPYKEGRAEADYSYWIVPFLFESRSDRFGVLLGEGNFRLEQKNNALEIKFLEKSEASVKLNPEEIIIDESLKPSFVEPYGIKIGDIFTKENGIMFGVFKQPNFLVKNENGILSAGWVRETDFVPLLTIKKDSQGIRLIPYLNTDRLPLLNPIFQPDRSGLIIDMDKSVFYWNNREAVAGRNPLRLFILPQNSYSRPVQVKKVEVLSKDKDKLEIAYPEDYSFRVKPWFIDIFAKNPLKTEVMVMIDDKTIAKEVPAEFVTDCQENIIECFANPKELMSYIKVMVGEQKTKLIQ